MRRFAFVERWQLHHFAGSDFSEQRGTNLLPTFIITFGQNSNFNTIFVNIYLIFYDFCSILKRFSRAFEWYQDHKKPTGIDDYNGIETVA